MGKYWILNISCYVTKVVKFTILLALIINACTLFTFTAFDGVSINNLEEEDRHLLHGWNDSDSENEFIYHERMPQNILEEVWDLAIEDVETDFPQGQSQHPSVVGNNTSIPGQNFKDIVNWLQIFLCLWSSFFTLPDNALDILLSFWEQHLILWLLYFQLLQVLLHALFPRSVHLLRKQLGLGKDRFIKYVVCPKCHSLYVFDDCYELWPGKKVTKKCSFVQFPNHCRHFCHKMCEEQLLKEVSLKTVETKLHLRKVYCYNSVISNLQHFLQRPSFAQKCELWSSRDIPDGFLADIFWGKNMEGVVVCWWTTIFSIT